MLTAQVLDQILNAINAALQELWKVLIFDNNVLFSTVLAPFKLLAGFGFLYQVVPLLKQDIKNSLMPLLTCLVILTLFMNGGNGMRMLAISEYAMVKGIDKAIKDGFEDRVQTAQIAQDLQGNQQAIDEVRKAVDNCLSMSPTVNGDPNPTYTKCEADARALIQNKIASGEIKDPSLKGRLLGALAKGDAIGFFSETFMAAGQALADASLELPRMIFASLRSIWMTIGEIALLVAVIAVPLPLALSFFNPQPLIVWHGSFWGSGIFMFSMTMIVGMMDFFQSKVGAGLPTFMIEVGTAIAAPLLAGAIAVGGGMIVIQAFTQAATKVVDLGVKATTGL